MESKKGIEVFGTINKQETVLSVTDRVLPGSLVFEAIAPFPGYYHAEPNTTRPVYLYLALQEQYPLIDIIRASEKVERIFDEHFDAGKGFLQIRTDTYYVLRIRHLNQYDLIGKLQQSYRSQGLLPLQKTLRGLEETARIRVVKFFQLEPLEEGIYLDRKEACHAYLEIPRHHSWEEFNELTMRVKYNWEGSKFDAATGAFHHQGRLHEFVRIYSSRLSPDFLQQLRQLYLKKIR
ncbi:MAG: hypothetical protein AB7D05_05785 [Mangrovibacterium sp.]